MIDQQTIDRIDRVAVGLAELILQRRSGKSRLVKRLCWLLKTLIDAPFHADRIKTVAEGHHGTPEQLVAKLREKAVAERGEHEVAICGQCHGVIERDSPSDDWEHQDKLALHKASI